MPCTLGNSATMMFSFCCPAACTKRCGSLFRDASLDWGLSQVDAALRLIARTFQYAFTFINSFTKRPMWSGVLWGKLMLMPRLTSLLALADSFTFTGVGEARWGVPSTTILVKAFSITSGVVWSGSKATQCLPASRGPPRSGPSSHSPCRARGSRRPTGGSPGGSRGGRLTPGRLAAPWTW